RILRDPPLPRVRRRVAANREWEDPKVRATRTRRWAAHLGQGGGRGRSQPLSELIEERARQEHFDCHRGIFRIWGPLPALAFQPAMTYEPLRGPVWTMSEGIYRTIF